MDAAADQKCFCCGEPSEPKRYCPRCDGLLRRTRQGSKPNRAARREAMQAQWRAGTSEHPGAFVCAYTGIDLTHKGGAANAEWEHVVPGDETSVKLVAALVNRMKADLTEKQWDRMIAALYALRIEHKAFDPDALPDNWGMKASSYIAPGPAAPSPPAVATWSPLRLASQLAADRAPTDRASSLVARTTTGGRAIGEALQASQVEGGQPRASRRPTWPSWPPGRLAVCPWSGATRDLRQEMAKRAKRVERVTWPRGPGC